MRISRSLLLQDRRSRGGWMKSTQARGFRARGLTLIEAAMSMMSVGAVMTVVVTSAADVRGNSQIAQCRDNQAQISMAGAIHAMTDPDELSLPKHALFGTQPGTMNEAEWGGKAGRGEPQVETNPYTSKWGTAAGRGPATRGLNQVLFGDVFTDYQDEPGKNNINWLRDIRLELDVYRCPEDYGYAGHHFSAWRDSGLSSYDHYGNSYTASAQWIGVPGGGCTLSSNTSLLRPLSTVPNAEETLFILENAGRFAWRKNFGSDDCSFLSGGPLADDVEFAMKGWHGPEQTYQAAFVDGHVDSVYINGHQIPQPRLRSYPSGDYQTWHCVIIRSGDVPFGSRWQVDTLPADPYPTGIPCFGSEAAFATTP